MASNLGKNKFKGENIMMRKSLALKITSHCLVCQWLQGCRMSILCDIEKFNNSYKSEEKMSTS
jgi:hypothetical protein